MYILNRIKDLHVEKHLQYKDYPSGRLKICYSDRQDGSQLLVWRNAQTVAYARHDLLSLFQPEETGRNNVSMLDKANKWRDYQNALKQSPYRSYGVVYKICILFLLFVLLNIEQRIWQGESNYGVYIYLST